MTEIQPRQLIQTIDLTSLSGQETPSEIEALCQKVRTPYGSVAAVCLYPKSLPYAKACLTEHPEVAIATVANFPEGNKKTVEVLGEIEAILDIGVDEIDLVIPYSDYLAGDKKSVYELVKAVRAECPGEVSLKVILETGAFDSLPMIYDLSCLVLDGGANFIKTSTGKMNKGATLEAAEVMFKALIDTNPSAGFKASGGVRTPEQAQAYLSLATQKMSALWADKNHFRIGASALLDALLV